MLGYVKADKPNLKMGDYEVYRAVYCSLCNALGRNYSVFARLLLSYDFALAAVLKLAIGDESCVFDRRRCPLNPMRKCAFCRRTGELDFCAHCVVIIAYYKLKDNLKDRGVFKKILALIAFPAVSLMHKKAKRLAPEIEEIISESMNAQARAEENAGCSVDEAAHPSAHALGRIFAYGSSDEEGEDLYKLGYFTGRYIYILDAADDYEDDIKKGNFNPLESEFGFLDTKEKKALFADRAEKLLNQTQAQLLEVKDQLKFRRFGAILENVLFGGLEKSARSVIGKYTDKENKNEKSFTVK